LLLLLLSKCLLYVKLDLVNTDNVLTIDSPCSSMCSTRRAMRMLLTGRAFGRKIAAPIKKMAVMQILPVVDQLECVPPHLPPNMVRKNFREPSKPCYHGKGGR